MSVAEIAERFGDEVASLVEGVTKLSKFSALSAEEQHAESIRKMFLAMAQDIRVVLIKLGDRLHNMRTLAALPPEKQRRIARQTHPVRENADVFADRAAMLHPRHHLLADITALAEIEAVEEVHIRLMRKGVAIGEIDAAHRQAKADAPRLVIGPVSRRIHGVARDNRPAAEIGAGIGGEAVLQAGRALRANARLK